MALQGTDKIVGRHRATIAANMQAADDFFQSRKDKFCWRRPAGGSIAFPRLLTGAPCSFSIDPACP